MSSLCTSPRTPSSCPPLRERCGPSTYLVGFKLLSSVPAETLIQVARQQVVSNDLDLCLANDLAELEGEQHPAWLVAREGQAVRAVGSKANVADQLVRVAVQRGLRNVGLTDLKALLKPPDAVMSRDASHPAAEQLFRHHPALRVLIRLEGAHVLATARGTWAFAQGADEAPITSALAQEAWTGRWRGGGFSVNLENGSSLIGLTQAGLWGLAERWQRSVAAWHSVVEELGHDPTSVQPRPLWHGSRLVGVTCEVNVPPYTATAVWIRPESRGHGRGDHLLLQLSAAGHHVWIHPDLKLRAWFTERGWRPVLDREDCTILEPPSARRGLNAAASVCLLDPLRRRVLIGRRLTPPWNGYWAFPGGSREGQESALQTGLRELAEETGITLEHAQPLLETHLVVGGARGYYVVNFVVPVFHAPVPTTSVELEPRWVDLEDVRDLAPMAAGTRRIVRRLLNSAALTPAGGPR